MEKSILILGAGRSSASLIQYLAATCSVNRWQLTVGDYSIEAARSMSVNFPSVKVISFDIQNKEQASVSIKQSDIVISLLPAHFHFQVAERCLELGKHLITASYVTQEMKSLHEKALAKGLLFLNECGLDPGIDHMSAMQMIDKIKKEGGVIDSFYSFTGGLISPQTDPGNPWRYKFTWNSRNVVMAGQDTAKYLDNGEYKYIPYQQLFTRTTEVHVEGLGDYEGYANRDSLKYISSYGLENIRTMLRGTLRSKGFCSAWNVLVQLGCCDDTFQVEHLGTLSHLKFISSFVKQSGQPIRQVIASQFSLMENSKEMQMLDWAGLFSDEPVGLSHGTPAQALEHILNKKWKLVAEDKDQIVMWHKLTYTLNNRKREVRASLVCTGENSVYTAMAKTVGLPLGIAAKLLAQNQITSRGVVIPISPEFYNPVLKELSSLGIELKEKQVL